MSRTLWKINKQKARIKDYKKKKNIIKNSPRDHKSYKKPVFKQEKDRMGVIKLVQIGEKEVRYSLSTIPRVQLPKSKKYQEKVKKVKLPSKWVSKRSLKKNVKSKKYKSI